MQLSVREVAAILNVSEQRVLKWIKQRGLPASRVNDQHRVNRSELLEWAISDNKPLLVDLVSNGTGKAAPSSFVEALREGGIVHGLGGTDKASVLHAVIESMKLPINLDREFLFEVLLAREALGSTALGDGIAIPHPRNPIVLHVEKPTVCLGFLANPIEFGAIDGQPVHTLFTFVSPTVRAHLHLLAQLVCCLRDPGFKAAINRRATEDEVFHEAHRVETELKRDERINVSLVPSRLTKVVKK